MLTFNFTPCPTLSTERLTLRPLTSADAPALFAMRADPEVMQYIPRPLATTVADAAALIEAMNEGMSRNELLNWGIARHTSDEIIGTIGFYRVQPENHRAEIGYLLHPSQQGQGLMQEAVAAALEYGFEVLQLHSVEGVIDPRNEASARVLLRAGFVQEGLFRQNGFWNGQFQDTAYYSLRCPASR
ncbi:GNAT family N-acetyltransferase [Hymenobacter properus]|uniref:GNAT family N-acetyltransferase n=1 Tax=Hymenobacter properus TaxID=2791026 RepID=A0A931BL55_9BACT|nr:GNAT family N-acetyltransferase [Hymenobacter properus]MBF9144317.1 GNAT family N-acetyltransferase [Hymenobacter properus]MBR7723135.1 GNAT family N-acetyltransferase [Microvirga sp. SRT04]